MQIPWQQLSADALRGIIEDFVTREGTEYGAAEVPLAEKVVQVKRQLERGEAVVDFDPDTGTATINPAAD